MENKRRKQKHTKIVSFIPNGDYYYQKALSALEREQPEKAYKYIKRAAELSPDDGLILMQYGVMEMEAQNIEHAYELIHTAYSLEPNEPEIVFMLAEVSGYIGHIQDAKKYAYQYLELEPNGMYRQEAEEMLEFLEIEQEMMPSFEDGDSEKLVAQEKARRLMEQGDFPKAIEVLEQLIEKFPDAWPAYNNLSLAYFYIGEADQAKALLNHVMRETNGGNLHAICNMAVMAYYEKDDERLTELVTALSKIQPYEWDNRYKLGATLALIGEYQLAYKWLRSMSRKGYEGDPGFYFWLAHSAYFSGHDDVAKTAWSSLLELDPTKEGYEPWLGADSKTTALENNREAILEKINSEYTSERVFGFFLLKRSPYKQEILAHPKWIDVTKLNQMEKLALAYAIGHQFNERIQLEQYFMRGMQTAEEIMAKYDTVRQEAIHILQLWFALFELAMRTYYPFKNSRALAAAAEYMFKSALEQKVTKKEIAEKYEVSVATLTKYCDELLEFVPTHDSEA